MKIQPRGIDKFLQTPGNEIIAVLIYGPDGGLVRERAETLTKVVAGRRDDPFLVTEMIPADLRDDPTRLMDEAQALAFGGGRRVVRLRGATNGQADTLKLVLETLSTTDDIAPALVIAEAGELRPQDKLRKLFESADRAAAVACYLDDGRGLEQVITETLARHKLRPSADARAWLAQHLGADRMVTRGELEKLALYCTGQTDVTLDDCLAVIGDGAVSDLEQAVFAATNGDFSALDTALARAFREGISPIAVIRAAMRHLQRLHQVTGAVDEGVALDAAVKTLKPPPFFKVADRFRAQARAWPVGHVERALEILSEAELKCKTTGMPDQLVCSRALMQVAQAGRNARRA
jgi:DNA polymerase-3 subunit delta